HARSIPNDQGRVSDKRDGQTGKVARREILDALRSRTNDVEHSVRPALEHPCSTVRRSSTGMRTGRTGTCARGEMRHGIAGGWCLEGPLVRKRDRKSVV